MSYLSVKWERPMAHAKRPAVLYDVFVNWFPRRIPHSPPSKSCAARIVLPAAASTLILALQQARTLTRLTWMLLKPGASAELAVLLVLALGDTKR